MTPAISGHTRPCHGCPHLQPSLRMTLLEATLPQGRLYMVGRENLSHPGCSPRCYWSRRTKTPAPEGQGNSEVCVLLCPAPCLAMWTLVAHSGDWLDDPSPPCHHHLPSPAGGESPPTFHGVTAPEGNLPNNSFSSETQTKMKTRFTLPTLKPRH